jgi:ferredoxin/flavodoxin---NADP+ reductase
MVSAANTSSSPEGIRVAVVGSGPAGFYAADMLLKQGASVDVFERLPAPFGLLRYGVAPDHQNIKRAGVAFERTAQHPNFRYFGNVEIGRSLSISELLVDYDQLLVAIGSGSDRKLGLPGEDLRGSVAATSLVGWYNGHPDFYGLFFDLDSERAVVVGIGNVALDVARLLVRSPSELASTDIASHALEAFEQSRVREVVLLGRRGPAQAAFDQGELADIAALPGVEVVIEGDVSFEPTPNLSANAKRNLEYLSTLPRVPSGRAERLVRVRFLASPKEIHGLGGRVDSIDIERTELVVRPDGSVSARGTGEIERLKCGLVVRSIGYQATPLPGLPFDDRAGVIPNQGGRVGLASEVLPRCYVVGWIKRGPVGLLGSNKQDAKETVDNMLADRSAALESRSQRAPGRALELLRQRAIRSVSYAEWQRIDAIERESGKAKGKVREKLCTLEGLLGALDQK